MGSIWMRPNGGLSSSGTQNMQSSTGQYSTQAGEPAQPVQHSVMTASSFGFFLRAVTIPFERGSNFCSSGTIPGAFATSGALAISRDSTLSVKSLSARFIRKYGSKESVWQLPKPFPQRLKPGLEQTTCVGLEGPPPRSQAQKTYHYNPSPACYNAGASDSSSLAHHVPQTVLQTPLARAARRTCVAPLFHLAFPFLFRLYRLLRRIGPQLAIPRCLRLLLPRADCCFGCTPPWLSGTSQRHLFSGRNGTQGRHAGTGVRRSGDVRPGRRHRQSSGGGRSRRNPWPRGGCCALADGALPFHGELRGSAADGSAGDIFHHARAADFSIACGNAHRSDFLEARLGPRRKKLVRRRTRCWARNTGPAGNAAASCGRADRVVAAPSPSRKLEKARGRNAVDGRRAAAAAGAVGRAQRGESWTRAVSRAALRGNVWRRPADRILRVDENVDVPFSRCVLLHLEIAGAADRIGQSSAVRGGF